MRVYVQITANQDLHFILQAFFVFCWRICKYAPTLRKMLCNVEQRFELKYLLALERFKSWKIRSELIYGKESHMRGILIVLLKVNS